MTRLMYNDDDYLKMISEWNGLQDVKNWISKVKTDINTDWFLFWKFNVISNGIYIKESRDFCDFINKKTLENLQRLTHIFYDIGYLIYHKKVFNYNSQNIFRIFILAYTYNHDKEFLKTLTYLARNIPDPKKKTQLTALLFGAYAVTNVGMYTVQCFYEIDKPNEIIESSVNNTFITEMLVGLRDVNKQYLNNISDTSFMSGKLKSRYQIYRDLNFVPNHINQTNFMIYQYFKKHDYLIINISVQKSLSRNINRIILSFLF